MLYTTNVLIVPVAPGEPQLIVLYASVNVQRTYSHSPNAVLAT